MVGSSWAQPAPQVSLPSGRAGVTHVAGDYRFRAGNYLIEGAERIQGFGSKSIMLFFEPHKFNEQYPDNNKLNNAAIKGPHSLTELAKTDPFATVFTMPFSTIVLTAYSHTFPDGPILTPSPQSYENEELEFYELTKYLLSTYSSTSEEKIFILTNWEADNTVSFKQEPKLEYNHQNDMTDADGKVMIEWLSARQKGVSKARAAMGSVPGVQVFHAVTINRTLDVTRRHLKRVLNMVVPFVKADMVGCSCYDAMIDNPDVTTKAKTKDVMNEALSALDHWAPDDLGLGKRRIYVAEYGLFENDSNAGRPPMTPKEAIWRTEAVLESVAEFGASYAFFWQLFDNECNAPDGTPLLETETALGFDNPRRPKPDSCRGLWLIKPDGTEGTALSVLRRHW